MLKPGDICYQNNVDGSFSVVKILEVDDKQIGGVQMQVYHVLIYANQVSLPEADFVPQLPIQTLHAPLAADDVNRNFSFLAHISVENEEINGYLEYLKHTDFSRYLEKVGLSQTEVLRAAQEAYNNGILFHDSNDFEKAVYEYEKAVDLFPLFYEALDNAGFANMRLGRFKEAIRFFQRSYEVQPESHVAFFEIGECLYKLGDLEKAKIHLQQGLKIWPTQEVFHELLKRMEKQIP